MEPDRRRLLALTAFASIAALSSATVARSANPAPVRRAPKLASPAAEDIDPQGYLVSEKLDGVRALWDGQSLRCRSGLPILAPP